MYPSQDYAFEQAEKALDEIKCLLMNKYQIDVFLNNTFSIGQLHEEQKDNFKVLDGLIKEIFWNDASINF